MIQAHLRPVHWQATSQFQLLIELKPDRNFIADSFYKHYGIVRVFRRSSAQGVDFLYRENSYKLCCWELGKIWRESTVLKHLNLIRTHWNIPQGSMTAARGHHEGLQWESSLISILFTIRAQGAKAIRKTRETTLSRAPEMPQTRRPLKIYRIATYQAMCNSAVCPSEKKVHLSTHFKRVLMEIIYFKRIWMHKNWL